MHDHPRLSLLVALAALAVASCERAAKPTAAAGTPARVVKISGGAFVEGGDVLRGEGIFVIAADGKPITPPQRIATTDVDGKFVVDLTTSASVLYLAPYGPRFVESLTYAAQVIVEDDPRHVHPATIKAKLVKP